MPAREYRSHVARRRWRWISHYNIMAPSRVVVEWKPEGRRKRGRSRMTLRSPVGVEATAMVHSWGTIRTLAQGCLRWSDCVAGLVVYDKKGINKLIELSGHKAFTFVGFEVSFCPAATILEICASTNL